ncbi:MAG: DEAD/DEAH box helicase [Planctomycetes bacterium]|nr:DEAD/DEAH box helicase [Planctomycetota bacterium]MBI3844620.1 DEAD/DEAH box helicase [Planctomycetota bacterium]
MSVQSVLDRLRTDSAYAANVAAWRVLPAREATTADFPTDLDPRLVEALRSRGITRLFSHQRQALDLLAEGRNVVVVTPPASGKSLCYNLPVFDSILKDPERRARALYVFPTKALSQDQLSELWALDRAVAGGIRTHTYDGDTPPAARRALRESGDIIVTNPYMLHTGILPNHSKWVNLFQGLRWVVIDELHTYPGVFGSHVANVIRRLKRVAAHYGASPRFIACSATIANPVELASRLCEEPFASVTESGAPQGEKHVILYNPPLENRELGIRRNTLEEVRRVAELMLPANVPCIFFSRSRTSVEILVKYLKDFCLEHGIDPERVAGYRGGYLPELRRDIERRLRAGELLAVAATNALELGVDIGSLEGCVIAGYPGSVASTWQQAGRAGRRSGMSAAIVVGRSGATDQYLMRHPEHLLDRPAEHAVIDADNLVIRTNHLKCAAFEIPFRVGENFGATGETAMILDYFEREAKILHRVDDRYFWADRAYPAEGVSLNAADIDNFVVVDVEKRTVLAEVDRPSAMTLIHEGAIHGHQGEQYLIEKLDYAGRRAHARKVNPEYYTEAMTETEVRPIRVESTLERTGFALHYGEVTTRTTASVYKKIRFYTGENVGAGEIHLPAEEMDTTAFWIALTPELASEVRLLDGNRSGGLVGLARALGQIVPLFVRCDPSDVRTTCEIRSSHFERPVVTLYDNLPGGVGLAERTYELWPEVLGAVREQVERCACRRGCPSCVGPPGEVGPSGKEVALELLRTLAAGA